MSQKVEFNINTILSNPLDFTNILFVSKGGNDTTALTAGKYDFHKQWLNPTVAMANAVSGDTVCVYAGEYTIGVGGDIDDDGLQYLVKDGVTLYLMAGVTINYTNLTGVVSTPFFDGGVASTFIIRGDGNFIFNRNTTTSDTWLTTTNVDSVVDWESNEVSSRRRFGNSSNNFSSWRMVGKKITNKEAMLFAFRFPIVGTTNKNIFIKFEETVILEESVNNLWTRVELRNFNGASKANIDFGVITYPHAYPSGAFVQITGASSDSEINIKGCSIKRTNDNGVEDYLVLGINNFAKGRIKFTNIDTCTGIAVHVGAGGSANVNRIEEYQGVVRGGWSGLSSPYTLGIFQQDTTLKIQLDLIVVTPAIEFFGMDFSDSPNTVLSGKVIWLNDVNPPLRVNSNSGVCGRLENLIISNIPVGIPSMENFNIVAANLKVMNSFATNSISPNNGGVVQLIETIKINSNI